MTNPSPYNRPKIGKLRFLMTGNTRFAPAQQFPTAMAGEKGGRMMYDLRQFEFRTGCLATLHFELFDVRKQKGNQHEIDRRPNRMRIGRPGSGGAVRYQGTGSRLNRSKFPMQRSSVGRIKPAARAPPSFRWIRPDRSSHRSA